MRHFSPDNRIGQFNMLYEQLEDRPLCEALFGKCVVIHCEDHECGRGKRYIASSDLFEPATEGEEVPEYRFECTTGDGKFEFKAIRNTIIRVPPAQVSHQVLH